MDPVEAARIFAMLENLDRKLDALQQALSSTRVEVSSLTSWRESMNERVSFERDRISALEIRVRQLEANQTNQALLEDVVERLEKLDAKIEVKGDRAEAKDLETRIKKLEESALKIQLIWGSLVAGLTVAVEVATKFFLHG